MPYKIPKLGTGRIIDSNGRPVGNFQGWINQAFTRLEKSTIDLAAQLGLIQAAQERAEEAALTATWNGVTGTGRPENNADVTTWINGADADFRHDYQGNLDSGQARTLFYVLEGPNGVIPTGTTWTYKIISGTLNGIGASATELALNGDGGIGRLAVASLASTSVVEIACVRNGARKVRTVRLTRIQASAPVAPPTTTTGGSTGPAPVGASTTQFSPAGDIGFGELARINMVASTGVTLTASVEFEPDTFEGIGFNTVSMKWQRETVPNSGVWQDATTAVSGSTRVYSRSGFDESFASGTTLQSNGSVSSISGAQRFRLVAAVNTGRMHYTWGSASANPV